MSPTDIAGIETSAANEMGYRGFRLGEFRVRHCSFGCRLQNGLLAEHSAGILECQCSVTVGCRFLGGGLRPDDGSFGLRHLRAHGGIVQQGQ